MRHWITKWTVWEFMPWWLANIPVYGYWLWFSLRARHLVFFSNVNPSIPLGGAMGESKNDILNQLPAEILPKTVFVHADTSFAELESRMQAAAIHYPLIAKPDVGERGFLVARLETADQLKAHLERYPVPFIIQEFLSLPLELSVLFHRFPGSDQTRITSVCIKEFLSVQGDGSQTVRALMQQSSRASFQLARFEKEDPARLDFIPEPGAVLLLEPIGNHARGTKFLNGNHLIDKQLEDTFGPICSQIQGVLYGRFDLKTASVEALKRGDFKVMELNGILGEPAHIYDPSFGMWRAYRDLYRHWRILYRLHRAQIKAGIVPTPHPEAWRQIRAYFDYKKRLEAF